MEGKGMTITRNFIVSGLTTGETMRIPRIGDPYPSRHLNGTRETGMKSLWRLAVTPIFGFLMWNPVVKINHRLWAVPQSRKINPEIRGMSVLGYGFLLGWKKGSQNFLRPGRGWRFGKIRMESK
jgi:hypothetical protein